MCIHLFKSRINNINHKHKLLAAIPGVARENPIRYELENIEILNLRKHN